MREFPLTRGLLFWSGVFGVVAFGALVATAPARSDDGFTWWALLASPALYASLMLAVTSFGLLGILNAVRNVGELLERPAQGPADPSP